MQQVSGQLLSSKPFLSYLERKLESLGWQREKCCAVDAVPNIGGVLMEPIQKVWNIPSKAND